MSKRKWVQLVDADGMSLCKRAKVPVDADEDVATLLSLTKSKFADSHLHGVPPPDLRAFADPTAFANRKVLVVDTLIGDSGEEKESPIIVQRPRAAAATAAAACRKWIQVVDADEAAVGETTLALRAEVVAALKLEMKKEFGDLVLRGIPQTWLRVFQNRDALTKKEEMAEEASIAWLGDSAVEAIVVQLPRTRAPAALVAPVPTCAFGEGLPPAPLPEMKLLERAQELKDECLRLATQAPGCVCEIPRIHEFMEPLGSCTKTGKLYWREEESQLSLLLRSVPVDKYGYPVKKNVLMGSPGVGKSTMLCILALHFALVGQKNVLVLRQLKGSVGDRFCLFVVRPTEDGSAEWFSLPECTHQKAVDTFNQVKYQKFKTVRMLDGFRFHALYEDLHTFHFLATSQPVNPSSEEFANMDRFLLPSWRRDDLFVLGKRLYGWQEFMIDPATTKDTGMVKRFYYSGGSAREFTRKAIDKIAGGVVEGVATVHNVSALLSVPTKVLAAPSQSDRLRQAFIDRDCVRNHKAYRYLVYWKHVVDSEYAISLLRTQLRASELLYLFSWASAGGPAYASLAGLLFELIIHSLASENALQLVASEYDPGQRGLSNSPTNFNFQPILVSPGKVIRSGVDEASCDAELVDWWTTKKGHAYWYPSFSQYKGLDGALRLADGQVAYLRVTASDNHVVDTRKLWQLNERLGVTKPPLYIVVCPTEQAANDVTFKTRGRGMMTTSGCSILVGYWLECRTQPMHT